MRFNHWNTCVLIIPFWALIIHSAESQQTAGSIPFGTNVIEQVFDLSIAGYQVDTLASIDINCDGIYDFRFRIYQGYPPGGEDNFAQLQILNDSFSICSYSNRPEAIALYNFGDTLCSNNNVWNNEKIMTLGCYGYKCEGLDQYFINSKYIAFQNHITQEEGWIRISMNLFSEKAPQPLTLSISEMLVLCLLNNVKEVLDDFSLSAYPNPTLDGHMILESVESIHSINIMDAQGQLVQSYTGENKEIVLPIASGIYIIAVENKIGRIAYMKALKL